MAPDMRPFSVVENDGFTHLLSVLEPRYQLPSRPHFSQNVLPPLYNEVRAKLVEDLSNAIFIALTTDGWTSRATQSFMTITAHYITDNWVIKNPVLQTRAVYECHVSDHLSEILQGAVAEWKIEFILGVDRLSAPILSILPIINIGHFKNRFADYFFLMQTNILFTGDIIYWWINNTGETI